MAKIPTPWLWKYQKRLRLSGTGAAETNYILKLNLHRGHQRFDATPNDVFLDEGCNADFSDIRFTDGDYNLLDHCRVSYGNYELYDDSRLGEQNWIDPVDGMLLRARLGGALVNGLRLSNDNGANWRVLYGTGNYPVWIDSQRSCFTSTNPWLKKSIDWKTTFNSGVLATFTTVIDMTAVGGYILPWSFAENSAHVLYCGRSQAGYTPTIYKSTDHGDNWTVIFDFTTAEAWQALHAYTVGNIVRPAAANNHLYVCTVAGNSGAGAPAWPVGALATVVDGTVTWRESNFQHVHGLGIDLATDYIYAGIDGGLPCLIRSIDGGTTWFSIYENGADRCGMYLGNPAFRIFGSGWLGHQKGTDIIRTINDVAFTIPLALGQCVQTVFAFGTVLYGLGTATGKIAYSRIFRSIDNGVTWTLIWIAPLDSTANFNGIQFASNVGIPTGEAEQQVLLGNTDGALTYIPKRLFDGGAHYQGLFYVKMPTLPAAGGDIYVWFGNPAAATASDNTIWYEPAIADIRWQWRLDEGAGGAGTAIDEAIDAKDGILTPGASGAWVTAEGRYAGPVALPYIVKTGAHYNFAETGYVNITGSGVDPDFQGLIKNYTVIAWIKSIPKSGTGDAAIFIKGYGTSQYGLVTNGGSLSYHISNAGDNHVDSPNLGAADTNGWHMVGAVLADHGGGQTDVYLICDGLRNALGGTLNDYSPVVATRDVRIGAGSDGSRLFPGEIDEVTVYNRALTALEVQQIYEMRSLAATEPTVTDQHYYDYLVEGRRRRLTNLLTHARRFFAAGLRSRQFRR